MKWKFDSMVDTICRLVCSGDYGQELIKNTLSHSLVKAYKMGVEDTRGNPIPVMDFSYFPEIHDGIRHRWDVGKCN